MLAVDGCDPAASNAVLSPHKIARNIHTSQSALVGAVAASRSVAMEFSTMKERGSCVLGRTQQTGFMRTTERRYDVVEIVIARA